MTNPEYAAMRKIDGEKRTDYIKKTADLLLPTHDKIAELMRKYAVDPEQFHDLYKAGVDHDLSYVKQRKRQFAETKDRPFIEGLTEGQVRDLAEILEYHILRGINIGGWLPACRAVKTSEYDDIYNGVDLVVEFQKDELYGHLGMGIDVSFSHNLRGKFQRIKDEIDAYDGKDNRLGVVKYFKTKVGMRGELSGLPRVVTALDVGVMEDLARAKNDDISTHMARHEVVLEMEHQLAVFADYAQSHNPACLDHIARAQNFTHQVSLILESKQKIDDSGYTKNRKINQAIEDGLSIFR